MTPDQLCRMEADALAGSSLPAIAGAVGVSKQRVYQLLEKRGLLDRWRDAAWVLRQDNFGIRRSAKFAAWKKSERGQLATEAAEQIFAVISQNTASTIRWEISEPVLNGVPATPRVLIHHNRRKYRLRLSFTKTAHSCAPSGCHPLYFRAWRTPKSWLAVILPDGRKLIYPPVKKARQAYINADWQAPFPPLSIPAIVY